MSKYLDAFAEYMRKGRETALAQTNPRHRDILLNYNRHAALEFSDRWQEIFTPEMTNDHPHYIVKLGIPTTEFDGTEEVKGFYTALNDYVVWLQDEELFVNDWGLASKSTFGQFLSGADAKAAGYDGVDDEEATYMLSGPLAMFWPYDEDAKLIGEEVWELEPLALSKPDPADVFTFEERKAVLEPYVDFVEV